MSAGADLRFKRIRFVTPAPVTEGNDSKSLEQVPSAPVDGNQIKNFYEELISGKSEGGSTHDQCHLQSNNKPMPPKLLRSKRIRRKKLSDVEKTKLDRDLLFSSQNEDVHKVRKLVNSGADINTTDMFGWTPLMCASHSGSHLVVEYLLQAGVKSELRNSQGRAAQDLARIASRERVLHIFERFYDKASRPPSEKGMERFFCDVCEQDFNDINQRQHETSTIHLFNLHKPTKPTRYLIPENNPGFQIMVKDGWDTEKGLGPLGKGRKFPIKTVLKTDRAGIGVKSDAKPRITHQAPQISDMVKEPIKYPRDGSNSRKAVRKRAKVKDKQWEKNIRLALS